ncbi:MAG: M14 family zinc carboxypeptidase [Bacteroidota bacterium]
MLLRLLLLCLLPLPLFAQPSSTDWMTPFETQANTTATYAETIAFYQKLAAAFPQFEVQEYGSTDSGHPLHLAILSTDRDFDPISLRAKNKTILMVNNAIHPGEPCGIDATMLLLRDYLSDPQKLALLNRTVLIVIPFYNIGGGLNRNGYSRVNQNGPQAYGFRGNARNLDLNRDFVKCDTRNAQTFNQIYGRWQPDVLIDNHTSNGADYQYTMTLIPTHPDKLAPALAEQLEAELLPALYDGMRKRDWEMIPYVYARESPDQGIAGFLDLPRYSSGYAALFHSLSFMPETHMLKPFADRVRSTQAFMECMIEYLAERGDAVRAARQRARAESLAEQTVALHWEIDQGAVDQVLFKGYAAKYRKSTVSGLDRLYYDREAPYEKEIPYYNTYRAKLEVARPLAYILPQAYAEVAERLRWNGVVLRQLAEDVEVEVELYRIGDFKTGNGPYEGHYLHSEVEVEKSLRKWSYRAGDYVIYTQQSGVDRYLIQTLEPQAPDSWFAWNFFDGILNQKEYFSAYVFEDLAAEYLDRDPELRRALEAQRAADPEFAASARAQLQFVYERSPHYESTHRIYPVGRLMEDQALPLED